MADFTDDFTPGSTVQCNLQEGWVLNVDGASKSMVADIRIVLTTPKESIIEQSFTLDFLASNNETEYEAVLTGPRMAITLGVTGLEVRYDYSLVVNQVNGEYIARNARMAEYLRLVLGLKSKIPRCDFKWVSKSKNNHANLLAICRGGDSRRAHL